MSRTAPHVVSARLTKQQLSALDRVALSRRTTRAHVITHAAVSLLSLSAAQRTDGLFRDLLTQLGLDPNNATTEEVETALEPLISALALPDNADPLAPAADPLHPASSAEADAEGDAAARGVGKTVRKLTAAEATACSRRGLDPTPENWLALRRSAVRRVGEPVPAPPKALSAAEATAKAKGITPEQLIAARRNAVTRIGGRK